MQDWEHISDRVLRLFAEAFLQRLAEAAECGCTLSDTAVKSTFTRAVKQEPARRIVERLRQTDQQQLHHRANLKQATNVPDHRPHHPPRDPSYDYVHPGQADSRP